MVLDGEQGVIAVDKPFQRPVVEVDVRGRAAGPFERRRVDGEAVVLARDLDAAGVRDC